MRVYRRKRGDVLQPARYPLPVVLGLKMKPREWSGQYQQEPVPSAGEIFDSSWWKYYKPKAAPEFDLVVLSVDCSFRATATADYVSIQKWGQVGPRSYLLDCRTEHLGFAATKAAIRAMQQEGRPASTVLVEARANGDAIIEELKNDPDFGAAVIAIEPEGGKESRAHAASTDIEAGNVYLPEDATWLSTYLKTFAAFPGGRHDDDVDATTQFLGWRRTRNLRYAVLEFAERLKADIKAGLKDTFGNWLRRPAAKAKPAAVAEPSTAIVKADSLPTCPVCTSGLTRYLGSPGNLHCNACATDFHISGAIVANPSAILIGETCCSHPLRQVIAGGVKCGNCGLQSAPDPQIPTNGVTFKQARRRLADIGSPFALRIGGDDPRGRR